MSIRSKITRKTAVLFGIPAVAVLAGGLAFAAAETVNTTTLGGGSNPVTNGCNVSASYTGTGDTAYSSTPSPGYYVNKVTVTPSETASHGPCAGKAWKVTLTDSSGTSLGEATGTFLDPAAAQNVSLSTAALASDVANIYGVITG